MTPNTTRHAATHCPVCGVRLDASTPADGNREPPKEGDLTLCFECGEVLTYERILVASSSGVPAPAHGVRVRALTDDERAEIPADIVPELERIQRSIRARRPS